VLLQLRGFSVFIDVERLEARKFDNNPLESIRLAKNFILVFSPSALDRCIGDHECKGAQGDSGRVGQQLQHHAHHSNFHWPDPEQLPEDMRSISYFNEIRWIHDYQDACVDKVERLIRGESNDHGRRPPPRLDDQSKLWSWPFSAQIVQPHRSPSKLQWPLQGPSPASGSCLLISISSKAK
jgi:hypothetical protein